MKEKVKEKFFVAGSILYGVATYFYYEKVGRTMCSAIVSNLLKLENLRSIDHPTELQPLTVSKMLDIQIFQLRHLHTLTHFFISKWKSWMKCCNSSKNKNLMRPEYIAIKNIFERQCHQLILNGFQWKSVNVYKIYFPSGKFFEKNSFQ